MAERRAHPALRSGSVWRQGLNIQRSRSASIVVVLGAAASAAIAGAFRLNHAASASASHDARASRAFGTIDTTLARDDAGCAGVRSDSWHPLSGVEYTGRLRVHLPAHAGAQIVWFIGDRVPLEIDAASAEGRPVAVHRERLPPGPGVHIPPDFWLDDSSPWNAPGEIVRVAIDANALRDLDFTMSLGRRAPRVLARLFGYPPEARAPVCAEPVAPGELYFASGWYGEEDGDFGRIRWMSEYGAVLLSSSDGRAVHVQLRAAPAVPPADDGGTTLSLRVNDFADLASQPMQRGLAVYEWEVPDAAWVTGTNELFFHVSRTVARGTRTLGLALASLTAR